MNFIVIKQERVEHWRFLFNWELIISVPRLLLLLFYFHVKSPIFLLQRNCGYDEIERQFLFFNDRPAAKVLLLRFIREAAEKKQ